MLESRIPGGSRGTVRRRTKDVGNPQKSDSRKAAGMRAPDLLEAAPAKREEKTR